MVEPKYSEIQAWLLPMVFILEEIEELLGSAQITNRALIQRAQL